MRDAATLACTNVPRKTSEIERLGCALIATTDTSSTTRLAPAAST